MSFETKQKIRFGHVDKAGIAYYPQIFHLCHVAFEEMWEGYVGKKYHIVTNEEKFGLPAVHFEADFHAPLKHGAVVSINVSITDIGNRSVTFKYDFSDDADNTPLATVQITTVAVDMDSFDTTDIPSEYRLKFEELKKSSSNQ